MVDWDKVHTVFLDMDGTLLDLHFDNHFWLEHLPVRYAQKEGMALSAAKEALYARFAQVEGTLQWYCLDYWSTALGVDVVALKREVAHLIDVKAHVREFLDALRADGKRVVLLTNAHRASLHLKLEYTGIEGHFDRIISAHDLGEAKESPEFWPRLRAHEPYEPAHALLVDDNLSVLKTAVTAGVGQVLAVRHPDSRRPPKETPGFDAVEDFRQIMPMK